MPEKRKQAETGDELAPPSTTNASKRLREESENETAIHHQKVEVEEHERKSRTMVFPRTSGAEDIRPFIQKGCLKPHGLTKAFYADGAHHFKGASRGLAASAVAWMYFDEEDNAVWKTEAKLFEKDTADYFDAELHAIQMAFGIAIDVVKSKKEDIENIVIWSDCQTVLDELIRDTTTTPKRKQSSLANRREAFPALYEKVALLESLGVSIVVAWIKGHGVGDTACEGNIRADRACRDKIMDVVADYGVEGETLL